MNLPAVLDNIIGLLNPKGESVIGLDLGSSSIKVVQARNKMGKAILETYGEVALGPYVGMDIGRSVKLQPEQMVMAIKDLLRESNVTTKIGGIAIPLSASLITTIKVPQVAGMNQEEVISMEARRYIPVSMSEVTLDWQIIPEVASPLVLNTNVSEKSNSSSNSSLKISDKNDLPTEKGAENKIKSEDVLIVAVHTETINGLKSIIQRSDVECKFFELEAFSAVRSVLSRSIKAVVVADLGASSTKMYIVDGGIIRTSHVVPFGSQEVTLAIARSMGISVAQAEKLKRTEGLAYKDKGVDMNKIVTGSVSYTSNEISKVMREYQLRSGHIVEELVLTGGGAAIKGISQLFKEKMPIPVRVADPFLNLMAPAFLEKVLKEIGPSFSVAVGAVLRAFEE